MLADACSHSLDDFDEVAPLLGRQRCDDIYRRRQPTFPIDLVLPLAQVGQIDVDLAFVIGVDRAMNKGFVGLALEGTNDP